MDEAKRQALWEAYFNADFRARYFDQVRTRKARRLTWLSIAIALLSCGPLVNVFWQTGAAGWLAAPGFIAAALGIYIAGAGLPRTLAVAIEAQTVWTEATTQLGRLWARCQAGEDIWAEYEAIDRDLSRIDPVVMRELPTDDKLINAAWAQSEGVLAPS